MLVVERLRPAPTVLDVGRDAARPRALGDRRVPDAGAVPGVSRSGATIVGGMLLGLDRPAAAEFSFFLAMPTMAAAFVHDLLEVRDQLAPERGAGDRRRLRDGVPRVAARRQAVPGFVRRVRVRAVRVVPHRRSALALLAAIAAGWL